MNSSFKTVAIATALVIVTATGALAQAQQGGVQVGAYDQTTVTDQTINFANGRNAKARQAVGAAQGLRAGYVKQVTIARRSLNFANGRNAAACQTIGTIGKIC